MLYLRLRSAMTYQTTSKVCSEFQRQQPPRLLLSNQKIRQCIFPSYPDLHKLRLCRGSLAASKWASGCRVLLESSIYAEAYGVRGVTSYTPLSGGGRPSPSFPVTPRHLPPLACGNPNWPITQKCQNLPCLTRQWSRGTILIRVLTLEYPEVGH